MKNGYNIFHLIAYRNHKEFLKFIIESDAKELKKFKEERMDDKNMFGITPITSAVKQNNVEIYKNFASILGVSKIENILHLACLHGSFEIIKDLLNKDVPMNTIINSKLPVYYLLFSNKNKVLKQKVRMTRRELYKTIDTTFELFLEKNSTLNEIDKFTLNKEFITAVISNSTESDSRYEERSVTLLQLIKKYFPGLFDYSIQKISYNDPLFSCLTTDKIKVLKFYLSECDLNIGIEFENDDNVVDGNILFMSVMADCRRPDSITDTNSLTKIIVDFINGVLDTNKYGKGTISLVENLLYQKYTDENDELKNTMELSECHDYFQDLLTGIRNKISHIKNSK